jgi:hypothetical protein
MSKTAIEVITSVQRRRRTVVPSFIAWRRTNG